MQFGVARWFGGLLFVDISVRHWVQFCQWWTQYTAESTHASLSGRNVAFSKIRSWNVCRYRFNTCLTTLLLCLLVGLHSLEATPYVSYKTGRILRTSPLYVRLQGIGCVFAERMGYERPMYFKSSTEDNDHHENELYSENKDDLVLAEAEEKLPIFRCRCTVFSTNSIARNNLMRFLPKGPMKLHYRIFEHGCRLMHKHKVAAQCWQVPHLPNTNPTRNRFPEYLFSWQC